jgi:hypothetical protein
VKAAIQQRAEARRLSTLETPTYQIYPVMEALKCALRSCLRAGEMLIWRDAWRWNDVGVLSNHYESLDLSYLCECFGYEVVHDFRHVAIVRQRLRVAAETTAMK